MVVLGFPEDNNVCAQMLLENFKRANDVEKTVPVFSAFVISAMRCVHFHPSASQISGLGWVYGKPCPCRAFYWNPVGKGVLWGRGPGLLSQLLQGLSQGTLAPARGSPCCLPALCSLIPAPITSPHPTPAPPPAPLAGSLDPESSF